jgi:7-cyano-7-deazaguanine synthase
MEKALVIYSAGQDSMTCLLWAIKHFSEVRAIHFRYGQKHSVETKCAIDTCRDLQVPLLVFDLPDLRVITDSELLESNGDVNKLNDKSLPSSFVPNRNQMFITFAHAYAQKIGAKNLILGACETDYSGYPDCRREFIDMLESATNLGSASDIKILTPLMRLTKAQTFKMAKDVGADCLNYVLTRSHTCYNNDRVTWNEWGYGCGDCPACGLRKKGYEEFKKNENA